jgi:threonine dehydrogenase-like Zn-dependent dehydrogenase
MAVEEVPPPEPAPGALLLRPEAAGICGSEVEGYLGRMGNRTPPLVMGHEFAGTVGRVGEGVDPGLVGRVVAVNPLLPCGSCPLCRAGLTNVCPRRTLIGIQHPGGFAELVRVPADNAYPLPEGVEAATGALAEPLANGVHAVRVGMELGPVENAVIIGAGAIGLMVMEAALLSGLPYVAVVEPYEPRREHARRFGAHATFSSAEEAREALRLRTDGLGADLIVDAVGAEATRRAALGMLRPAGTLVALGLRDDVSSLPFHALVRNQITVRGSYAYTRDDYRQALDWLVEGRAGIGELPPALPLERGPEVFSELARGPSPQVKIFLSGTIGGR